MNVGTIGYSVRSGLGILAKSFVDNGVVNRILVVPHPAYPAMPWYKSHKEGGPAYSPSVFNNDLERFAEGLDALLIFENAFKMWSLVELLKSKGTKIVCMPMYEWTPYPLPVPADKYITVSDLDEDYYNRQFKLPTVRLNVPANPEVKWRLRERATTFVHNAGHGGKGYRNGTPELLQAMKFVKSPLKLIVRGQQDSYDIRRLFKCGPKDPRIEYRLGNTETVAELYDEGDVFIFPEHYNGLSLPMQEAFAAGMLVMGTRRFPMNRWLPIDPLIAPSVERKDRIAVDFTSSECSPEAIAQKIDEWYMTNIERYSVQGRLWAADNSWENLKPLYRKALL